jgi:hypothetical protein
VNVCSLKKFAVKVVEKHIKYEKMKKDLEKESAMALNPKVRNRRDDMKKSHFKPCIFHHFRSLL